MILDTNAISALFAGEPGLASVLAGTERHHVPTIVLGEYRFGLLGSRHCSVLEKLLDRLEGESILLYPDRATAVKYAEVRHRLKRAGTPIPENDVWIAALALQHELPVVTQDRHYDRVAGLTRLGWELDPS